MQSMHKRGRLTQSFMAVIASVVLALALVPAIAMAGTDALDRPVPTADQIATLLDGCDFVEGEAIVVAEKGARLNEGASEQLAEASSQALEQTAAVLSEDEESAQGVAAERAEQSNARSYVVTVVRSETKSTAELIAELYENPKVISVEPNYVLKTAYAEAGEGEAAAPSENGGSLVVASVNEYTKSSGSHYSDHVGDLTSLQKVPITLSG